MDSERIEALEAKVEKLESVIAGMLLKQSLGGTEISKMAKQTTGEINDGRSQI
jgi:hypothetical protein